MKVKPNTVVCGDAYEILPDLPDGLFDAVISDIPYGVTDHEWDKPIASEMLGQMLRVSKGAVVLFGAAPVRCLKHMLGLEPEPERVYIWFNSSFLRVSGQGAFYKWQAIYVWRKERVRGLGDDVLRCGTRDRIGRLLGWQSKLHPAQKPLALMVRLVQACTKEGESVADFFCGSGTTLEAAFVLNRRYFGIDISEEYCGVARERLRRAERGALVLGRTEAGEPEFLI